MSDSQIDLVATHVSQCEACHLRLEQLDPSPIIEGFRQAFSNEPSNASQAVEFSNSKQSVNQQVDSILDSIRPIDSSENDNPLGKTLFEIKEKVSENSFCEVHLATDTMIGNRFFIHRPHAELVSSVDHCSQFFSDARRSSTLQHDQIISVANSGWWIKGHPYYAIQWHDSSTLEQVIAAQNPIDLDSLIRIIVQVCIALRAAHQVRVAHRHLSPKTIHVSQGQLVRVAEFGLTYDGHYQFGLVQPLENPTEFHSPEARENDTSRLDLRTDIWSFGALLNWLLDHAEIDAESTTADLTGLAKDCQRKSRRNRIQSMAEVQDRLFEILKDHCPGLGSN